MTKVILCLLGTLCVSAACYDTSLTDAGERTLELRVEADSLPADGATLLRVIGSVPPRARAEARTVAFTTNGGSFVDGGAASVSIIAVNGSAETSLRAPRTPGAVRIRAQRGTVVRDTTVHFYPALPSRADLQPSAFVVKGSLSNQITITAHLRRNSGVPTAGFELKFQATREDNQQPLGRFGVASPSDANAVVTVTYSAGDTEYRGPVRIRALTTTGRVLGETTVDVIAP